MDKDFLKKLAVMKRDLGKLKIRKKPRDGDPSPEDIIKQGLEMVRELDRIGGTKGGLVLAKAFKPQKWNDMTVSAHGRRIGVHLNGHRTAELPADKGRRKGRFALQLHGGQDMHVRFRRIEILRRAER